eukprot:g1936.t1
MAPITSVAAALQRRVALGSGARQAVRTLNRETCPSRASGAAARAAASTLSTKADYNADRPVQDVVVVGAGVAGLATAACLGRLGIRVTIATGLPRTETRAPSACRAGVGQEGAGDAKAREGGSVYEGGGRGTAVPDGGLGGGAVDPGVGIWTHGLACLDELGILRRLEAEGRYMGAAGYRDAAGNWLATPSQPLQAYDASRDTVGTPSGGSCGRDAGSGASVLFVRESKLIEALQSAVPENVTFLTADVEDISWGSGGCDNGKGGGATTHGERRGKGVGGGNGRGTASGRIHGGGGDESGAAGDNPAATLRWTAEFELLVGADGPDSFVRNEAMIASLGARAAAEAAPQRRGYAVYRGVCRHGGGRSDADVEAGGGEDRKEGGWGLESFQTWGPGLRFASVPLAGDERMWFATVADGVKDERGVGGRGGCGGGSTELDPASPSLGETKAFLLGHFGGWHEPISSLIRATEEAGIVREDACAMSRLGLRAAAAAGAALRQLDPVLAQGAGVALEDAFFLARHVENFNAAAISAPQAPKPETEGLAAAREGLEQALARYDADRLKRVGWTGNGVRWTESGVGWTGRERALDGRKTGVRWTGKRCPRKMALLLSYLSDVSQTMGQLRRPGWLVRARDSSLARLVPSKLRSRVFDALMSASLSGSSAGALTAAARGATRKGKHGGGRGRFGGYGVPRL